MSVVCTSKELLALDILTGTQKAVKADYYGS